MNSFLRDVRKHLSDPAWKLAQQAIDKMQKSQDPYHDVDHVQRMFKDFQKFLKENPAKHKFIDKERMVLSILWHDVWKSERVAKNALEIIYHQFLDGIGSAKLFKQAALSAGLDAEHVRKIVYSIRKHAHFQFLPIKTFEAKLLRDLDDLDLLNLERLKKGISSYSHSAPWRLKIVRRILQRQTLSLPWAKKQQKSRLTRMLAAIDKILHTK